MNDLKGKAINAVKWNTLSRFASYFLKFTLGVILARLLSPEEFGLIALVTVITELSNFIINGGFSASLIQNKNVDNRDFSTVFYINIGIGFFFTLLFFFGAPLFVKFYEEPRLDSITRVLSFTYLLNSLTVVQKARFIREINFKRISIIDILVQVTSGLFGIVLALSGIGYWTLVWKRIFQAISQAGLYFYYSGWSPDWFFSKNIFEKHWSYSNKILMANFFKQLTERVDLIVVGKFFNASDLGVFERGKNYAFLPVNFTAGVIHNTIFPVFSKLQDNKVKFLNNYIKIYRIVTLFILPVLLLLIINAKELILLLIGHKWEAVIPFLKLFSIAGVIYMMNVGKPNLLNAMGFPKYTSRFNVIELILKPTLIIGLVAYAKVRMEFIVLIFITFFLFRFIYFSFHLSKKLDVNFITIGFSSYRELIVILISSLASLISFSFFSDVPLSVALLVKVSSFILVYIVLIFLFLKDIFLEAKNLIFSNHSVNKP